MVYELYELIENEFKIVENSQGVKHQQLEETHYTT